MAKQSAYGVAGTKSAHANALRKTAVDQVAKGVSVDPAQLVKKPTGGAGSKQDKADSIAQGMALSRQAHWA